MAKSTSDRIIATPSSYAREHYLYVQEVGTLQSLEPHISRRQNLNSYLFFIVLKGSGHISYDDCRFNISAGDWSLMWVHFYGKEASCFYDSFLKQSCPFLFRPQNTIAFTDILHHLYQIHSTKPSLLELYANRYLTELITLCFSENLSESREPTSISEKIKQVHGYLDKYYAEKINLENLSSDRKSVV